MQSVLKNRKEMAFVHMHLSLKCVKRPRPFRQFNSMPNKDLSNGKIFPKSSCDPEK